MSTNMLAHWLCPATRSNDTRVDGCGMGTLGLVGHWWDGREVHCEMTVSDTNMDIL